MALDKIRTLFPYKDRFFECSKPLVAKLYRPQHTVDLISGEKSNGGKSELINSLKNETLSGSRQRAKVIHLFYEFGFLFNELGSELSSETVLAIEIEYNSFKDYKLAHSSPFNILEKQSSSFEQYSKKFSKHESILKMEIVTSLI